MLNKIQLNAWIGKIVLATGLMLASIGVMADKVAIGALVAGQVTKVYVEEGQAVKVGMLLLEIDAQAHYAKLSYLKAEQTMQKLKFADAQIELEQALDLYDRTVTSKRSLDAAQLLHDVTQAALNKASADLQIEQAWSKYYKITAPVSGKVAKIHAPKGSTVFKENSPLIDLE